MRLMRLPWRILDLRQANTVFADHPSGKAGTPENVERPVVKAWVPTKVTDYEERLKHFPRT